MLSRQSWVATVYIAQNLDGIVNVMSGNQAKERARSLLGNLNLIYFCSNGNYSTNIWASNMIGQNLVDYENLSISADKKINKNEKPTVNASHYARLFTTLKIGRKVNKYLMQSIVFKASRTWSRELLNLVLVGLA
ncbi:hypothetical protein KO506_14810 [Polaribacter vadi]|uniref:hypothetical protein n=1 Tax=Polaribacter TaxID=52959 RepID=UPI001C0917FC|nr:MULTISPECIES: hypothetical protein [Polaribacter]MBU3012682.1 hypothetical protein [Polaribacter vadi]MDO6742499.1 hypothetical protein [Polaribacter sp. 1_MG-2023]